MKLLAASGLVLVCALSSLNPSGRQDSNTTTSSKQSHPIKDQKIQVAILLDVSGSMGGLIDQAKAQLWNMVSVMGRAKCENGIPKIEIALYEYGRPANDVKTGYIKQISPFTSDLDQLSQELFKLTIDGGDEYCGHVIHTSLNELRWDTASSNYKVIFIAGNEDFLQGTIQYSQACKEAKSKGVIVNTIYCGDKAQGIREHWNLAGECGNGSYTNIDQNVRVEDIPTPYDSVIIALNGKLNGTYLTYGAYGYAGFEKQAMVDEINIRGNKSSAVKRAAVKADKNLYNNSAWDMVDAYKADSTAFIAKLDMKTLPDSLKNKDRKELEAIVKSKNQERGQIQKEIQDVNTRREQYIAAEKARAATNANTMTLETEVEKMIKEQVKRFGMKIE